ncbi:MAG: prephenate dehydratase [Desulfuromonas sp.]
MSDDLKPLRESIDAIDDKILALLNDRAKVVMAVAQTKKDSSAPFYVPSRENAIYARLCAKSSGPFPEEGIRRVFREIISASLALEEPMKVAFLGPVATFTHVAAMQQFGLSATLVAQKSISAVFDEVERGRADYGVVPVENSNEGVVTHTLDMFMETGLKIYAEILLEISHDLLSLSGNLEEIQRIYSHPQALAQCRKWLEENLPDIPLIDVASTAAAAQLAAADGSAAAIASAMAGSRYDLRPIKVSIADNPNNFTRFLIVSDQFPAPSGQDKTSIMFCINDEPGILWRMLEPFSKHGVNLTKIESRPLKKKAWEYIFFLDMEGHIENNPVRAAIAELEPQCKFLKVLGSYPRARG